MMNDDRIWLLKYMMLKQACAKKTVVADDVEGGRMQSQNPASCCAHFFNV